MDRLYSRNPIVREKEAAKYRVFHKETKIRPKWMKYWKQLTKDLREGKKLNEGLEWPTELLRIIRDRKKWPRVTFGTANAACLVVLHSPGKRESNEGKDLFISPALPVLGGIPHAHNAFWYPDHNNKSTYGSLHRYLKPAFARLKNPWSQIMTTNLTTEPARTGRVDTDSNLKAVNEGLLDFLVELCQPRIILLCGDDVHTAAANWNPPPGIEVLKCDHPSYQGWSRDGSKVKDTIEKALFS